MMLYRIVVLIFPMMFEVSLEAQKNYGSTQLSVTSVEGCKGPKRMECCNTIYKVVGKTRIVLDHTVLEDVSQLRGKIIGISNGTEVLRFANKRPCDNFALNMIFRSFMNVTEDCTILKGHYILSAEIEQLTKKFYNGNFFYGNVTVKSNYYNDKCNFFCNVVKIEIFPRNKEK